MGAHIEDETMAELQTPYLNAIGRYEIYLHWLGDTEKSLSQIALDFIKQGVTEEELAPLFDANKDLNDAIDRAKSFIEKQKAKKIAEFDRFLEGSA